MDWVQLGFTFAGIVVGSGIIQFLITRKDKKDEDAKKDHEEELKKEMKDHLTAVNDKWKVDYCDKNAKAISELVVEVREGLAQREAKGKERYDEHHETIAKMNEQHQKNFEALFQTIEQLKANDTKITEGLEKMAEKQDDMANGIMGLSHDKLIYTTDRITERGAITLKEKATLTSIYEPYVALHGNGDAKAGYNHVMTLPVVSDEEAKKMDLAIKNRQRVG